MNIGIPRGLYYYQYFPFFKTFFECLGNRIVCSPPTNRNILKKGIDLCVDDACLPVKVFHGHVAYLADNVDIIYIPRIISVEPKEYICPKFLGLPDMIKNSIQELPPVLDIDIDLYRGKRFLFGQLLELGHLLKKNNLDILRAYRRASKVQKRFEQKIIKNKITPGDLLSTIPECLQNKEREENKKNNRLTVLLLGHYYNIYDDYISMNVTAKLRKQNITFITPEMVPDKIISIGNRKLSKNMFWTLGKKTLGTAYYYLENNKIDGIIYLASFGCGPDSLVGELVEKRTKRDFEIPFLLINLDEHSGEAGFNTRLEAFLDVLEGRKQDEDNISSYG